MPRKIVPIIVGEKYHVYNRGTDKRDIFLDKFDYIRFYNSLAFFNSKAPVTNYRLAKGSYKEDTSKLVNIVAYSLLPNHFHLIIEPLVEGGVSEFMKRVCGGYTSYFNERNDRSGALLQGTFKRVHISSDEQYMYLFAYVNENHLVHNFSSEREIYHSSSIHYQNIKRSKLITVKKRDTYSFENNKALAEQIYQVRKSYKALLE